MPWHARLPRRTTDTLECDEFVYRSVSWYGCEPAANLTGMEGHRLWWLRTSLHDRRKEIICVTKYIRSGGRTEHLCRGTCHARSGDEAAGEGRLNDSEDLLPPGCGDAGAE